MTRQVLVSFFGDRRKYVSIELHWHEKVNALSFACHLIAHLLFLVRKLLHEYLCIFQSIYYLTVFIDKCDIFCIFTNAWISFLKSRRTLYFGPAFTVPTSFWVF